MRIRFILITRNFEAANIQFAQYWQVVIKSPAADVVTKMSTGRILYPHSNTFII